ncbi:hypothetical protein K493DRAFT_306327 [Basidiobolus meristosporus CBS 931.73]|uniref:Uncharacterized protein n=1 Tax=Basidiobolus meristosporus CBS 931.73 TaxID=1314790 RepID=A0A1Y1XSR4_9FUNG|nr:hypothetical protein K493DRAFT_306327 [Basidiobolus meristosporus CBS 931.73]|eukprot:ORX88781.1 hypothetical protein K493DRAFT_306327 [Basidiobolus meristosporus CBS 931.73]
MHFNNLLSFGCYALMYSTLGQAAPTSSPANRATPAPTPLLPAHGPPHGHHRGRPLLVLGLHHGHRPGPLLPPPPTNLTTSMPELLTAGHLSAATLPGAAHGHYDDPLAQEPRQWHDEITTTLNPALTCTLNLTHMEIIQHQFTQNKQSH